MALHINRWSPDTCACVFDYQWDDSVPADQRVHTLSNVINVCLQHPALKLNPVNHYAVVSEENVRKNRVYGQLLTISSLTQITTNPDGTTITTFKNGVGFNYAWTGIDSLRILNITVFGANLTGVQKTSLQNWCDTNLGIGKVIIN